MKKFLGEFKKFITRGNVIDMAVGVIVGGAFTGIVNAMSNNILKPLINFFIALIVKGDLSDCYTPLKMAYVKDETGQEVLDLANSIYIDWGAFITAVINFFIIAFVLFCIVKVINSLRDNNEKLKKMSAKGKLTKEQKKELKAAGIRRRDKAAVKAYFDEKERVRLEEEEKAAKEAEAQALAERLANPTAEDLLKKIVELMESK